MTQHLPEIINAAEPIVNHYGYLAIFGLMLFESLGLFFVPGETVLIVGAAYAGLGHLSLIGVLITALLGAVIGNSIGYLIGRLGGRRLVNQYGKYIFLNKKRLNTLENFFKTQGGKVIIFARFIDGLRQFNGIVVGLGNMSWVKFMKFNLIGAVLWVGFWTAVGYGGAGHIQALLKDQLYLSIGLLILILVFVIYKVVKKRLKLS